MKFIIEIFLFLNLNYLSDEIKKTYQYIIYSIAFIVFL